MRLLAPPAALTSATGRRFPDAGALERTRAARHVRTPRQTLKRLTLSFPCPCPQRAASFCAERMQGYVTKSSGFRARDLVRALQDAFRDCEADFIAVAGREGLRDGTTAVVTLVEADTLTVAHVGDSRAILCRAGGEAVAVTLDHKPELAVERKRIEALGGFVSYIGCWRAMGILAMSRAIGDLFLKPYVSPEPDVSTIALTATDEFLVLASDGLFDVFDNQQVVRLVRGAGSPTDAASVLTESAFHNGSLDNVTAVVVALKGYRPGAVASSVAEPSVSATARSIFRSLCSDGSLPHDYTPLGGDGGDAGLGSLLQVASSVEAQSGPPGLSPSPLSEPGSSPPPPLPRSSGSVSQASRYLAPPPEMQQELEQLDEQRQRTSHALPAGTARSTVLLPIANACVPGSVPSVIRPRPSMHATAATAAAAAGA